jgi:hypothetical protein
MAAEPDPTMIGWLRQRLESHGFPCPDLLPDQLVQAVAEAVEDKARLDWIESLRYPELGRALATDWFVYMDRRGTSLITSGYPRFERPTLRASIDAARIARETGATRQWEERIDGMHSPDRLAEMRAEAERSRAVREDLRFPPPSAGDWGAYWDGY